MPVLIDFEDCEEQVQNPIVTALGDGLLVSGDRPDQRLPDGFGVRAVELEYLMGQDSELSQCLDCPFFLVHGFCSFGLVVIEINRHAEACIWEYPWLGVRYDVGQKILKSLAGFRIVPLAIDPNGVSWVCPPK